MNVEDQLLEAPSLRSQLYARLRAEILNGTLAPGARISPAETARRFGVSAMPVRDALALLEKDGLVETAARRWTRVVELSPELVEELVPIVSLLEQHALTSTSLIRESSFERLDEANAAFAAAVEAGDTPAAVAADAAFHDALVAAAANRSLERALEDARARIRLLRPAVMRAEEARESIVHHAEIVELLRRGNHRRAAEVLARNWERGLARYRAMAAAATGATRRR